MNGRTSQSPERLTRARGLASTTALCAGLCVLAAAPALAVTPEEADQVRADIEAFLADPAASSSMEWMGEGFSFQNGEVSVEAVGESFEILIPALVVVYEQPSSSFSPGDPARAEITLGDLNITMTPDPVTADLSELSAHIGDGGPVTITVDTSDGEGASIEIGSHELDGTWSEAIGYFVKGGFSFADIVATPLGGDAGGGPDHRIAIGLLSSESDLTEVEPGLWDGRADFVIENFVGEEDGEAVFSLGRVEFYETLAGFAFADYMDFVEQHPIVSGSVPEGTIERDMPELVRQALIEMPVIFDDFTIGWSIDGLEVTEDNPVAIGHHEFELGMTGLAGDMSNWHVRALVQDVTVPPDPMTPEQFVPTLIDIDLTFSDVPTGLAWQATEEAVATTPLEDLEDVFPLLAQQVLGLVMQAQTGMTIDGELDWDVGNVTMDGEVHADPSSPMMIGGSLAIVVRELDQFIAEVDATMGAEAASGFTILRSMGQEDEDEQGPVTVFEFVIEGTNILMNGQDLEPIVRMLSQ